MTSHSMTGQRMTPVVGGEVREKKAIVLVCPEDVAEDVAHLIASVLSLNGYDHGKPAVIPWPLPLVTTDPEWGPDSPGYDEMGQ